MEGSTYKSGHDLVSYLRELSHKDGRSHTHTAQARHAMQLAAAQLETALNVIERLRRDGTMALECETFINGIRYNAGTYKVSLTKEMSADHVQF